MSHFLAGWRHGAYDQCRDRLGACRARVVGHELLLAAADLPQVKHGIGVRIVMKQTQGFASSDALDGIAADTDHGGLADTFEREPLAAFVGQRAAARDHTNAALAVAERRHESHLRLTRGDDARRVRTYERRAMP